ncbi:rod shape determining protein RodA [Paenibacillus sp. 1_12]|uniref:FtsW/RodA/SpoVE family cell cycle protein n=1 Tax=Paenibacillus sp. 1_12 TaxID=1566278 RepID=UPI0008EDDA75|nr:FtsW/RodA/SpoVE family cell cycle protein [Paenibacillus sp. 1_12]SFK83076.1 rod shape determining protein RodA [Paenibacillus sp. 1_12]
MKEKLKRLDQPIIWVLLSFLCISTAVIFSATTGTSYNGLHINNAITFGILFFVMIGIALIDYRIFVNHLSIIIYVVGLILLLLVIAKGMDINGSKRWLNLGFMAFQPSEIMKICVILLLAKWMKKREGDSLHLLKDLLPMGIIVFIPFFIVLQQPDLGTSIVFVSIFIGMIWIGNIRLAHVVIGLITIGILAAGITSLYLSESPLFSKIVKPHQMQRIQTFLDPKNDPDNSWHVVNSIKAISAGQLTGDGYLKGALVHRGYIPYDYADSIFVVVGEEFGFLGASALLLLYFILIYRMIRIAIDRSELEGTYVVIGVISMFTLQIFENIAMHIGLMPLTGIALPFISYGGSSLLTNMISMGLVLSVKIHQTPERIYSD